LDALRTIISYRKTEFNALNYGTWNNPQIDRKGPTDIQRLHPGTG
jgi:hypothetical protein